MNIVFLDAYTNNPGDLSFERLESLGNVAIYNDTQPEEFEPRVANADILIVNKYPITDEDVAKCPQLKYIIVAATGYNNVDIIACEARSIHVSNIRNYSSNSVAQHVFALILQMVNRVGYYNEEVKKGRWARSLHFSFYDHSIMDLSEMTLGLVGWGNIAQQIASIAQAFGMNVLVHTRTEKVIQHLNVSFVDRETIFKDADILSLHCPLTDDTREIINKHHLSLMKPTSYLINTGRGGLVNESALFHALDHGIIAGAGLDVMVNEPPHITNPLMYHSKAIITPHLAWASLPSRRKLLDQICDCIENYQKGNIINQIC
jgi:glycerate dehydrogenase